MRLVYFSPVPWASFAQRPHRLVEWFHARTGAEVLWIEPYPTRLPALSDLNSGNNKDAGGTASPPWLTRTQPRALPIEPLPFSGVLNRVVWRSAHAEIEAFLCKGPCVIGVGKPSELALQVLDREGGFTFFDAMDDFPCFYKGMSRRSMARRERELGRRVDLILASSSILATRFRSVYGDKVTRALNACEVKNMPPPLERGSYGKPVLGYVGTIAGWFDWPLVLSLAVCMPNASIRLLGPLHSRPPTALPANVELISARSHAVAMGIMQGFDVGLIPFLGSELCASVDPIKYYEYRALGLPVLSSAFGEMAERRGEDGVFLFDDTVDLQACVQAALAHRDQPETTRLFRSKNDWWVRFDDCGLLQALGSEGSRFQGHFSDVV